MITRQIPPPSANHIKSRILYAPEISVAYLKNQKVGCSSVTKSLWLRIDELRKASTFREDFLHNRREAPFCRDLREIASFGIDRFLASEFFSVVRNPYTRTLSCYLEKFADPRSNPDVRFQFADRFGLPHDAVPSFRTFLDLVTAEDPQTLNAHYCPQWVNLLYPLPVGIDFIGHFERFGEVSSFLRRHGATLEVVNRHATGAAHRIADYYGPKETALVRDYYALDFELYGYSEDPAVTEPVRSPVSESRSRGELHVLLRNAWPPMPRRLARHIRRRAAQLYSA
jgi:hypothetical protein